MKIKLKNSSIAGNVPLPSDLEEGEVAINTNDGKLFTKKVDGAVFEVGANASTLGGTPASDFALKTYVDSEISNQQTYIDTKFNVYDSTSNGIVDNSEKLNGQTISYFASKTYVDGKFAIYDSTNNGIVDNSEKLNGQTISYFASKTYVDGKFNVYDSTSNGIVDNSEKLGGWEAYLFPRKNNTETYTATQTYLDGIKIGYSWKIQSTQNVYTMLDTNLNTALELDIGLQTFKVMGDEVFRDHGGTFECNTQISTNRVIEIKNEAPTLRLVDTTDTTSDLTNNFLVHTNSGNFYILCDRDGDLTHEAPYPLTSNPNNENTYFYGQTAAVLTRPQNFSAAQRHERVTIIPAPTVSLNLDLGNYYHTILDQNMTLSAPTYSSTAQQEFIFFVNPSGQYTISFSTDWVKMSGSENYTTNKNMIIKCFFLAPKVYYYIYQI